MNLPPAWVPAFEQSGFQAVHWSTVGDPRSSDRTIMDWARDNGYTVFTHDLDFGAILAVTHGSSPSVIQVRAQDVTPDHIGKLVINAVRQHQALLEAGALITIDEGNLRARVLPLAR